ncbi:conserved hypothetical protein [Talaromyces marneffei ATCC 18224]|uniref:Uncharacterized protein n=2 Tax=Talaromyces marneffei TaxID=37727 RepID=B6QQP1_TALMQ|nr:conserved hypothetical protein [Talaromyces marneffei ATCC 18224]
MIIFFTHLCSRPSLNLIELFKVPTNQLNHPLRFQLHYLRSTLTMSADLDGDSEMLSSSGSESPIGARTPTFDKPTELSPPGSQTASHHESFGGDSNTLGSGAGAGPSSSITSAFDKLAGDIKAAQGKDAPGASWNNQRAQEEFNRALESVVDRDFSLREFGDPFDESDMLQGLSGV